MTVSGIQLSGRGIRTDAGLNLHVTQEIMGLACVRIRGINIFAHLCRETKPPFTLNLV